MLEFLASNNEKMKLVAARAYASRFTDEELAELTIFERSDLAHDYHRATFEMVRDGVQQPGKAVSVAKGVVDMVQGNSPPEALTADVLKGLRGRMPETEISRLSTFFYNGVGKRLQAVSLDIGRETAEFETALIKEHAATIAEQVRAGGHCS